MHTSEAIEFGDADELDQVTAATDTFARGVLWLDELADWCRMLGLRVVEYDGWQRRGRRNNSPYDRTPTHLMIHHTASSTSPANDVAYMMTNADVAPLANLMIDRTGVVHVMAAGPTNTNGSGTDTWGGGVPADSMNSYALGVELANRGTGEPYPRAQTDAILLLAAAAVAAGLLPSSRIRAHHEWAPDRKIDPAGSSPWATGSNRWDMTRFRADVQQLADSLRDTGAMADTYKFRTPVRIFDKVLTGSSAVKVPNPGGAVGATFTVTVLDGTAPGFVTFWHDGARPEVSNVNYVKGGAPANNTVTVRLRSDGACWVYTLTKCRVLVDLLGTWHE